MIIPYRILGYMDTGRWAMIIKSATSGTDGKCDCIVTVEPAESVTLEYVSKNRSIYAKRTEDLVQKTAMRYGLNGVKVKIEDFGALGFVIQARLETAIERALGGVAR